MVGQLFSDGGMWLVFKRSGEKLYAKTPGGEYAYGDIQGLYEWRDGDCIRHYGTNISCGYGGQPTTWGGSGKKFRWWIDSEKYGWLKVGP